MSIHDDVRGLLGGEDEGDERPRLERVREELHALIDEMMQAVIGDDQDAHFYGVMVLANATDFAPRWFDGTKNVNDDDYAEDWHARKAAISFIIQAAVLSDLKLEEMDGSPDVG